MNRNAPAVLSFVACVLTASVAAQQAMVYEVPDSVSQAPAPVQPLPFSHEKHMSSGLACMNCHVNADPGAKMGFPAASQCMLCHAALASDSRAHQELLRYAASGESIPWVRVYEIASVVTWSHRTHLDAGLECETCHGDVRQMQVMAETKATRAMAACIGCHAAHEASVDCATCHAWPTDEMLGLD